MLALTEKQMLLQAIGRLVSDEISNAVSPLLNRIAQLEKVIGDMPVPVNGIDGKDADPALLLEMKSMIESNTALLIKNEGALFESSEIMKNWTRDYVQGALSAVTSNKDSDMDALNTFIRDTINDNFAQMPIPKDGKDGVDGTNGLDGARGADGAPGKDGAPGEPGKDGKDGRDGTNGENLSLDDVRDCLNDLVAKAVGELPVPRYCANGFIDRDGYLSHTFSDGSITNLGHVVGKDGKDCDMEKVARQVADYLSKIEKPKDGRDGKDGVGFDDLQIEYDGDRTVIFKFVRGENMKCWNFILPIPLYKGVWRQGEYERGDCVHREGGMFIALKDTTTEPGTVNSDWQLCTKRGRDGKPGAQGPQGTPGKDGQHGRDLTQLGPDGTKWR